MWSISAVQPAKNIRIRDRAAVRAWAAALHKPLEWAELIPSPPGAKDGREKWASEESIGASVGANSFTTPSSCEEAQAESRHAISKISIPYNAER